MALVVSVSTSREKMSPGLILISLYPRPGGYDFKPVLQVAKNHRFDGWVSMEVFDFSPGSRRMITEAIEYLQEEIGALD
jgi:sugar phosphate isomerase/epimerase